MKANGKNHKFILTLKMNGAMAVCRKEALPSSVVVSKTPMERKCLVLKVADPAKSVFFLHPSVDFGFFG